MPNTKHDPNCPLCKGTGQHTVYLPDGSPLGDTSAPCKGQEAPQPLPGIMTGTEFLQFIEGKDIEIIKVNNNA